MTAIITDLMLSVIAGLLILRAWQVWQASPEHQKAYTVISFICFAGYCIDVILSVIG